MVARRHGVFSLIPAARAAAGVWLALLLLGGCVTAKGGGTQQAAPGEQAAGEPAAADQSAAAEPEQAEAPSEEAMLLAYAPAEPEEGLTAARLRILHQRGLKARDRKIFDVAFDYFRRASNGGYGQASLEAGKLLVVGPPGLPQDYGLAARYYALAIERGVGYVAELPLGALYLDGLGVTQDRAQAERWFRRGAFTVAKLQGVVEQDGRRDLLSAVFAPFTVPPEFDAALDWVFGLKQSDGETIYVESLRYRDGDGVPQDDVLADSLLEAAALRDYPQAAYEIGLAKLQGPQEERDLPGGLSMLWRAAKENMVLAQKDLGLFYAGAGGDDLDQERAYYWLLRARRGGAEVEDAMNDVAGELSDDKRALVARNLENGYVYPP